MNRDQRREDLRTSKKGSGMVPISMGAAFMIATFFFTSGLLAAVLLPEVFTGGESSREKIPRELALLMSLTIDEFRSDGYNLTDVPFSIAVSRLMDEGPDDDGMRDQVSGFAADMLSFLLEGKRSYKLMVENLSDPASEWEISSLGPIQDGPPKDVQTVSVRSTGAIAPDGRIRFTLEIWEVEDG